MRLSSFWKTAALLLGLISPLGAAPVTAPYSVVFKDYPSDTIIPNLLPTTYGTGADYGGTLYNGGAGVGLTVTNVAGRDFELSTSFKINGQGQVGLRAFSSDADHQYQLLLNGGGLLQLSGADRTVGSSVPPVFGDLVLRGHYHDGILDLTGSLINGSTTWSVSATDTTPLGGQYFGVFTTIVSPFNPPVTTTFSHLTITVPEPSSALGFIIFSVLILRRCSDHFKSTCRLGK